jgi:hypothetical protein
MALHKTKDNFVWLDITDRCKQGEETINILRQGNELYAVFDDDSKVMLESMVEIKEALRLDLRVCIEVGYLPQERKESWWHKADKKIINGYFYVKYNDIKFGSV